MPTEDYDDIEEFDDDIEEINDDIEEIDDDREVRDASIDKGRRQLSRGAFSRFSDRLTGGPERPGEQHIARSPFVLITASVIVGLAVLAAIFYLMISWTGEERSLKAAQDALAAQSYQEAENLFLKFLTSYPDSSSEPVARIGLHTARVEKYTSSSSLTIDGIKEGLSELEQFISVCRDLEGFREERDNIRRYAEILTRTGALSAAKNKQQEPLDASLAAFGIMAQYSPEGGLKKDKEDQIIQLHREAEAEILKQHVLEGALQEINTKLEAGDSFGALRSRQALIDRYDVLSDDKDVLEILSTILDREKSLTVRTELGRDAQTDDPAESDRSSTSLTLRTQATVDQVSQGRRVFAMGTDSVYGLDSETGEPLWKRVVGGESPFAAVPITGTIPGLLVYHTGRSELMMLNQTNGDLVWRQGLGSTPSGEPLVFEQQIFVTTNSGEMWQLSADSGRAISKVTFQQPVVGPPAIDRDGQYLVIAGEESVVYTLSLRPLECVAVSHLNHQVGSVQSPILTMGKVFLLCDNSSADNARLRTLELDPSSQQLQVRATDTVNGHVRDRCILRGDQLFVPSAPQRITAFRVTDDPDATPLARVGTNQIENGLVTPMYLLAGPSGQLWMASQALRKFRVQTNALLLDSAATAEGIHQQPIQFLDTSVFLTTNDVHSASVFFTRVDRQQMTGLWRTVVGANLVAVGPAASDQSVLAISDFGEVFRVPTAEIGKSAFVLESTSRFRLPDNLADPVGGLVLADGRLAAWCGGDEPAMWTISGNGQLEQKWPLPAAPETQPASLQDGVVVALPGRLHMTVRRGGRVEDYRASQVLNQESSWKSLVALNDTQVIAVNSSNQFVKVEYRETPRPQLAEVSVTRVESPVEVRPTAAGMLLFVPTADGKLLVMQSTTLEVLSQVDLGGVPGRSALVAGDRVFVEVAGRELKAFTLDGNTQQTGSYPLDGSFPAGPPVPLSSGGFVLARSDGTVVKLDADGNSTGRTLALGQAVQQGPVVVGDSLIVVTIDGSLHTVNEILDQN